MRHLRSFNESVNHEDIQDFCEVSLAYLLDEGVEVKVSSYNSTEEEVIICFNEKMTWNECKDHIIPFVNRVVNKYELGEFGSYNPSIYVPDHRKKNFNFCVKGTHGVRADITLNIDEIKSIEQILDNQWHGQLIMDKIIFYVKGEK